jgi:stalled ribosome rescue protein Dom34
MSGKNKKQFGVWMDSQNATVVGRAQVDTGNFVIISHTKNKGKAGNSNENASNNSDKTLQQKFFKEIGSHMQNVEEVYVTGPGKEQEQFIRFLSETPQFKKVLAKESTSNKMSDEKLVEYMTAHFN